MIFFWKIPSSFDIENWLWKYNFGTFWRIIIHCRIVLKQFPLSKLILGQKSCILGPTIFKITEPNWHYYVCVRQMKPFTRRDKLTLQSNVCTILLLSDKQDKYKRSAYNQPRVEDLLLHWFLMQPFYDECQLLLQYQ